MKKAASKTATILNISPVTFTGFLHIIRNSLLN
jgi:hypothetical protein